MIIEISVAVIALTFIFLAIFVIYFLKDCRKTLSQVNRTLIDVREHLDELTEQTQKTLEHTHQISFDLKRKMESLDPLFHSISNVGEIFEHKTCQLRNEALAAHHHEAKHLHGEPLLESEERDDAIKAADIFDLIDVGFRLWHKLKKRR